MRRGRDGGCEIGIAEADLSTCLAAADWIRSCYPALQVELQERSVLLRSATMTTAEMIAAWRATLFNEKWQPARAEARAALLSELFR